MKYYHTKKKLTKFVKLLDQKIRNSGLTTSNLTYFYSQNTESFLELHPKLFTQITLSLLIYDKITEEQLKEVWQCRLCFKNVQIVLLGQILLCKNQSYWIQYNFQIFSSSLYNELQWNMHHTVCETLTKIINQASRINKHSLYMHMNLQCMWISYM